MSDYLSVVYDKETRPYTEYPQKFIHYLFNTFQMKEGMKILEPGCGRDEHLRIFQDLGLDVYGLDVSPEAPKLATDLNISVCDLESGKLPFPDNFFDVVYSKSFLEHLTDPSKFLKEAMSANNRIGFMQGRLSPLVNGHIQAFPWNHWQEEFALASTLGVGLMEWTLDQEQLHENPLLTSRGQEKISDLCKHHGMAIPSLTGDCFMQAPFWKSSGARSEALQNDFKAVVKACAAVGVVMIIVPLVDNGCLENQGQEDVLIKYLDSQKEFLANQGVKILFESDFDPENMARFIARLDSELFGINYDIGNSAALGFTPDKELEAYGQRIMNVHIKDRSFGGTTVPLGTGDADFEKIFSLLAGLKYRGNYILQTARAADNNHAKVLSRYYKMSKEWIERYGA